MSWYEYVLRNLVASKRDVVAAAAVALSGKHTLQKKIRIHYSNTSNLIDFIKEWKKRGLEVIVSAGANAGI